MGAWEGKDRVSYQYCRDLVQEAKKRGLWFNYGKDWYTPEEFYRLASATDVDGYTRFEARKIKMDDPASIIARMKQEISDQIAKLDQMQKIAADFASKATSYYKEKKSL